MDPTTALLTGIVATALADIWQQALRRICSLPIANWHMVGRWVAGVLHGTFVHAAIGAASPVRGEAAIGWAFHYAVGIAYAGLYLIILDLTTFARPGLLSALAFGMVTILAPWLVLQPALGLGVMARRLSNRSAVQFVTVTTHLVFGAGLYVGLLLAQALRSA
ncbi:MAG: DUF2938 family protein [Dongiaceae bacterium]